MVFLEWTRNYFSLSGFSVSWYWILEMVGDHCSLRRSGSLTLWPGWQLLELAQDLSALTKLVALRARLGPILLNHIGTYSSLRRVALYIYYSLSQVRTWILFLDLEMDHKPFSMFGWTSSFRASLASSSNNNTFPAL